MIETPGDGDDDNNASFCSRSHFIPQQTEGDEHTYLVDVSKQRIAMREDLLSKVLFWMRTLHSEHRNGLSFNDVFSA